MAVMTFQLRNRVWLKLHFGAFRQFDRFQRSSVSRIETPGFQSISMLAALLLILLLILILIFRNWD